MSATKSERTNERTGRQQVVDDGAGDERAEQVRRVERVERQIVDAMQQNAALSRQQLSGLVSATRQGRTEIR